ncbi:MAG: PEP-CTERM sorting domain-containing protein [Planctomycetales bacterium]|nr:PEP-CTERM sorting domain-containing protein [Planctomycetales bacterium]
MTKFVLITAALLVVALTSPAALAVDIEQFEFNDFNFTELDGVANTGTPGGHLWITDITDMVPAETFNGSFRITKDNDNFADNFLPIDNVATGSRFLVATMSGWAFRDFVQGESEEIRFGFINEDVDGGTVTTGSTVTAQMQIARDNTSGNIELRGDAVGAGSSDIARQLLLGTDQSASFTMVLELNMTSNIYEVFYKDGANPSQSLGSGVVAPGRAGNTVRFVVNNNFGSDSSEFFAIDRFALADANPLTDLLTLQVDRTTGAMTLVNSSGGSLAGLEAYSLTSSVGALDAAGWKTITDNYDRAAGPGDGSVDADDDWAVTAMTTDVLSEAVVSGNGGNLANNQQVVLSQDAGPWIKNPVEDLEITLNFAGGVTRTANVNYVGNGGVPYGVGDLNFDGAVTAADWTLFVAGGDADLSGMSTAQAYQLGDLNNDGANDLADFGVFKNAYEAANGQGSFAALVAIPEPSALALLACGALAAGWRRRQLHRLHRLNRQDSPCSRAPTPTEATSMLPRCFESLSLSLIAAAALLLAAQAQAEIFEDFQFNDPNGTLLNDAINSGTNGDDWDVDGADLTESSVQGGAFHITKANDGFATNYLDIGNITSGQAWLVAEFSGWNLATGTTDTKDFNPAELEELRFDFLDNDPGAQGNSTITAETTISRTSSGGMEVKGRAALSGTTGTDISPTPLAISQSNPFVLVMKLDKDANTYEILTNDNNQGFTSRGIGSTDPGRDGNSIRFAVNNNFGGAGEFFDIDRLYLTDVDPTGVVASALTLEVNTTLGTMSIRNDSSATFEIDGYSIASDAAALNFAGWQSFSDSGLDAIDGPDGDSTVGNGVGETWDETGGSGDDVLSERFLLGSSIFAPGRVESLGAAFKTGGAQTLTFQYRSSDTGAILEGMVEYVTSALSADFNADGTVDGGDFLAWQRGFGTTAGATKAQGDADGNGAVNAADLAAWQSQFGAGAATAAVTAVPEPAGALLAIGLGAAMLAIRSRRRWSHLNEAIS